MVITNTNRIGINCNAPNYTLDVSGSMNVSGQFTSRLRVISSTITTAQTITVNDNNSYFFYTTDTPSLSITLPTPAEAGSGWNVTIQNVPASLQVLLIETTPQVTLSRNQTQRFITDGISWFFI
jgi:hypothetical protein